MAFASHPVTALVVAVVLAGCASFGLFNNNHPLAIVLWTAAALLVVVAMIEKFKLRLRSPLYRQESRVATTTSHRTTPRPARSPNATALAQELAEQRRLVRALAFG